MNVPIQTQQRAGIEHRHRIGPPPDPPELPGLIIENSSPFPQRWVLP
ncbi:MAG: hypothetical protein KDI63_07535 [Gammaproteobacteria bacterium]|nr:hypothetical protein [Gammaproteobacteria bacterium]